MRVIRDQAITEDSWQLVPEGTDLPPEGDVVVSLKTWNEQMDALLARKGKVGVVLRSSEDPDEIQRRETLPLIAIDFPKFSDGRGYSSARLLRERLGYKGELRAIGEVLRDQLFYMFRCGIDSFVLKAGKDEKGALEAFREFSVTYQPAVDDPLPLFRRVAR